MRSFLLLVAMSVASFAQTTQPPLWPQQVQSPESDTPFFAYFNGGQQSPFSSSTTLFGNPPGSYLGVGILEINAERVKELKLPEERGVLISRVDPDSPASKAGLQVGDVLLDYNGEALEGVEQLGRLVHETPAGRKVKLSVWRAGKPLTLEAVIETRRVHAPAAGLMPQIRSWELPDYGDLMRNLPTPELSWHTGVLGIECQGIGDQLAEYFGVKQGVLVVSVAKGSRAEKAGLKAGDVITKIGDRTVTNPREIIAAIHDRQSKDVKVGLMRERKEVSLNVILDDDNSWGHHQPQPRPKPVSAPQ